MSPERQRVSRAGCVCGLARHVSPVSLSASWIGARPVRARRAILAIVAIVTTSRAVPAPMAAPTITSPGFMQCFDGSSPEYIVAPE